MDDIELGQRKIEELVTALAGVQGIDPKQVLFKWDVLDALVLPEYGIQIDGKIYALKIILGDKWQALTLSLPLVRKSVNNPEAFLLESESYVAATIRKLQRRTSASTAKSR